MIEKRMLVGSSQIQPQPEKIPPQQVCNAESSRGETPPAPIRKKVCSTEPIRGVLPPEPDRELMRVKDGYFVWEPLDSGDDSDEGDGVLRMVEDEYRSLMAARKEEKEIRRRLRESKQTTAEAQTSNKPRKGQWFCVYKGDMIQHQCSRCLKQDHAAAFCPYRNYVPKGAKVGPGYMIVCKCCGEEGGHGDDDENWVGVIIPRNCWNCRASGEHDTEDCPKERVRWVLFPWEEEHEHKSEEEAA